MNKKEINELEKQTAYLFNKYGFKTPRRILPNIIFDWMNPIYCFKVRTRTLLSELSHSKNFKILIDGKILTNDNGKPVIVIDSNNNILVKEIKNNLLEKGININKI